MINYGISVIICVHNGAGRIIPTLRALVEQNIPSGLACELLIIDNASIDNTAIAAAEYWASQASPFTLSILSEPVPGKANALIMGYNAARYELMLLCDDDNWLQPDYLKTAFEIYSQHPDIGLLGGFGKAVFAPGEKPGWFDAWENCFVCGEHHLRNGFLNPLNINIWGAGSVLRKTMWSFLRANGFIFINSLQPGKAMTEDAELSQAITFTGHRLYFDNRLWFYHDLRGGKITWQNFIAQQRLNGKNWAVLFSNWMAYYHGNEKHFHYYPSLIKYILKLYLELINNWKWFNNMPGIVYAGCSAREIIGNHRKYKQFYTESLKWVNAVRNTFPLGKIPDYPYSQVMKENTNATEK
jgi:glycosyltransferase involved in cell wall biosynthesis